jgi:hypothetical protein
MPPWHRRHPETAARNRATATEARRSYNRRAPLSMDRSRLKQPESSRAPPWTRPHHRRPRAHHTPDEPKPHGDRSGHRGRRSGGPKGGSGRGPLEPTPAAGSHHHSQGRRHKVAATRARRRERGGIGGGPRAVDPAWVGSDPAIGVPNPTPDVVFVSTAGRAAVCQSAAPGTALPATESPAAAILGARAGARQAPSAVAGEGRRGKDAGEGRWWRRQPRRRSEHREDKKMLA